LKWRNREYSGLSDRAVQGADDRLARAEFFSKKETACPFQRSFRDLWNGVPVW
jgi:hypothetical protein